MQHSVAAALADVCPRRTRGRTRRDVTLTELAAATGISKGTLSRLESGQRKPSLELLLPIAQSHQMGPGEVAESDTRLPHCFGPAGDQPVEILSLLGRHGERIHVRAAPRRRADQG